MLQYRLNFFCKHSGFAKYCGSVPIPKVQSIFIMNQKDIRLDLLRKIQEKPQLTQRELSNEMGVSVGKVNYCMKKLAEKGLIKISNFKKNPNKLGYVYLLTPKGIEEKTRLTFLFLKRKINEFETLKIEISELTRESEDLDVEK